jgi:hypothetical protein
MTFDWYKGKWAKRLLTGAVVALFLWCFYAGPRTRAATSTITGTITDSQGNPVYGTITFQLPVAAQDTATNTAIAPNVQSYPVVNGVIQAGPPLFDVAGLQPKNLFYIAKVYDQAGNVILMGNYVVTGASFNFGSATPTTVTTSNISFVTPVTLNVPNTFLALQAFPNIASSNAGIATAGWARLSNTDSIAWRNNAGTQNMFVAPGFVSGADTLTVNTVNFSPNLVQAAVNQPMVYAAGSGLTSAGQLATVQGTAAQGVVNGNGGGVTLATGAGLGTGNSGDVIVAPGAAGASGNSGNLVLTGRTFANLGTPGGGNGSLIFCSDCTIANPCAGGGSGALAKRLNGIWVCN